MTTAREGFSFLTEYQRSFRSKMYRCSSKAYYSNRDFRKFQKSRFQHHNHEPFVWEEDYESDENDEWDCDEGRFVGGLGVGSQRSPFVSLHHIKHEKWNRLYRERTLGPRNKESQTDALAQLPPETSHIDVQTQPEDDEEVTSVIHVVNPMHHDCDFYGFIDRGTQTPSSWWWVEKPPFANYGCLDNETSTGSLRTHNVKASRQVYPSALRAMRIKHKQNLRVVSSSCANDASTVTAAARRNVRSMPVLVRSASPSLEEKRQWKTEYDREFQPYERSQYHIRIDKPLPPRHADLQPTPPQLRESYLTVC